jgi:hypothetical protein
MQYGAACLLLAYLLEIDTAPDRALQPRLLAVGVAGMLLLAGGSLLGVPWAGAAFLAACWIVWKQKGCASQKLRFSFSSILSLGVLFVGMALLGFYYLGTLKAGAGASSAGKTNLVSCLFAVYEISGFAGLGPNRAELRDTGIGALIPYSLPLAVGFLVIFGVGMAGVAHCIRKNGWRLPPAWMLIALLLPLVSSVGLGVVGHFRILGRHLMPGFPLLLLLAAIALEALMNSKYRSVQGGLVALFIAVWGCSAISLQSPTHEKDNYRSAAAEARSAVTSGERVWWAADATTGKYYALDFASAGKLTPWMNATDAELANQPDPDLVILSKRDLYDKAGALEHYLTSHGFKQKSSCTAFTFFEKGR